jgi:hypothetical protein
MDYKELATLAIDARLRGKPLPKGVTHLIPYNRISCGVFFEDDFQVTIYYEVGEPIKQEYV